MKTIINIIKSIPDVVWAAIAASVLTLGGVFLSNKSSTNRLNLQLLHDAQQKDKDRKYDLRKNVFLKAAEEITNASMHIETMHEQDLTKVNIGIGLKGLAVAAHQMSLIASTETVNAINELMTGFIESFLKLSCELIPLQNIRTDINILNQTYENYSANVQRLLREMEERNISGKTDHKSWNAITKSFDFNQSECKKISDERSLKWSELNQLALKFFKATINESKSISMLTIPALVGIRKELDLETDEEEYRDQLKKQSKKMNLSFDLFLKKLEKVI